MSHTKRAGERKRGGKAGAMLGAAGVSLALTGGAHAATNRPAADISSRDTAPRHEITIDEEEISDISLATFYVFDKGNAGTPSVSDCSCGGCR
jgi:hypothetical protein